MDILTVQRIIVLGLRREVEEVINQFNQLMID